MEDYKTTFKTMHEKHFSNPSKLKEHFKAHFNICPKVVDPIELKDAPSFITKLQNINNTELNTIPPDID